jgi:competence protein ComEA
MSSDDRRAALLLLGLLLAGAAVRMALAGAQAPGAVGFRAAADTRPGPDSLAARAARLARPLAPGERIDVDRADAEELTRLPRIGPALARRIVTDREQHGAFGSLEELDRVAGIGPVLLETIDRNVTFSGRVPARGIGAGRVRVRLNSASAEELATLPGIGSVRAAEIVANRHQHGPFRHLDDLQRVPGIGPRTVERLRDLVQLP